MLFLRVSSRFSPFHFPTNPKQTMNFQFLEVKLNKADGMIFCLFNNSSAKNFQNLPSAPWGVSIPCAIFHFFRSAEARDTRTSEKQ